MDKIRCGVIGVGQMGRNHANFIRNSQLANLVALCDADEKMLKSVAEEMHVEKAYTDFRDLTKDPSVDAITICLPHCLHAPVGIEAMKHGKHVLTEKPMAITLEEADEMIETARKSKVVLGVSEEHRYAGQIQLTKKWMKQDRIGRPYLCSCTERFGGWKQPIFRGWRSKKEMIGGGSYIDQGHHAVDLIRYLMGDPEECSAYMGHPTGALEGEDITLAIYKHPDGAISHVHAGWAPGPYQFSLTIYGLKGTIIVDEIKGPGVVCLYGPMPEGQNTQREQPIERIEEMWPWSKPVAIENFLCAIVKNETLEYSGEEGKRNLAAILAAYESFKKGISVKIKY